VVEIITDEEMEALEKWWPGFIRLMLSNLQLLYGQRNLIMAMLQEKQVITTLL